ncbi:hypothetical protein E2P81_ATG01402 [Venturia nashicola]|uniref:Cell surface protein n=1 Tax=Venturia nashicola TaxID=86259 RepID=A0A4Z1PM41_9PEZI|nr:hypothetical protein E6O75_ATG01434 [Venturia nashicola]TLD38859.1 hypothetical protein E2P81_ATG01402 [Venturia nashicola]
MYTNNLILLALSAATLITAHGKVTVVTGDAGGNGTALGIQGATVARFGKNADTELDTTVFNGDPNKPLNDGLGKTNAAGKLKVSMLKAAMALSGDTLPQVSATGGSITGTWQTVTSDGTANNKAGELFAVLDTTGTGSYSNGTQLVATSKMVGNGQGNVVQKRATNVGADAKFSVKIPDGTTCTGSDPTTGVSNFCILKVVNNNGAGPFGGNVLFQIAGGATGNGTTSAAPAATTEKAEKTAKGEKAARAFQA